MREFTGPLSKDDLVWAQSRLPEQQVDRLIAVHGLKKSAKDSDKVDEAAAKAAEEAEEARLQAEQAAADALAQQRADEAAVEVERAQAAAEAADADPAVFGLEDLIGDTTPEFDVLTKTEAEVKSWAESATDEAKAEALAAEQGREDRDPRKGVVALLS